MNALAFGVNAMGWVVVVFTLLVICRREGSS